MAAKAEASFSLTTALQQSLAKPLVLVGKGLLYGHISIPSCLYRNEDVLVIYGYCSQPESPAADIEIFSQDEKQVVKINAESPGDRTPISKTDPKTYVPQFWYQTLHELPDTFSAEMDFAKFAKFFEAYSKGYPPACVVSQNLATCAEGMHQHDAWIKEAQDFRANPPPEWQELLGKLRDQIP